MNDKNEQSGIYYYHADHLGSSSVVTDKNGKFHEHLEYFPYGETWINDRANNENLPYRFTGKELDPETGLYYFGARYYDAKLSRWISADPILATGEYLPNGNKKHDANLPGMGGVFNSINLDGYQYCGQNPVKFEDPDGRENIEALEYMKEKLAGIKEGYWYFNSDGSKRNKFKFKEKPGALHCYQAVYCAYSNADKGMSSQLPITRWRGMQWFKKGGTFNIGNKTIGKSFVTDIMKGEQGDIVFMGNDGNMEGHAVLLVSIEKVNDNKVILNTYGAYAPGDGMVSPEIKT